MNIQAGGRTPGMFLENLKLNVKIKTVKKILKRKFTKSQNIIGIKRRKHCENLNILKIILERKLTESRNIIEE